MSRCDRAGSPGRDLFRDANDAAKCKSGLDRKTWAQSDDAQSISRLIAGRIFGNSVGPVSA